jgi:spore coat protein CotH
MQRIALLVTACLVAAPWIVQANPAKESDAFFNAGKVIKIDITIDKPEMEKLQREPRKYASCTISSDGKTYKDVGVHLKGAAGSYRNLNDRPGLTFNMNKHGKDQLFHGMDKWHLANSVQDGTWVHELICGELFRAAGVPASRVGHAIVSINGKPKGLYYLKEGYDKHFRRRHFENPTGNFYDGGFLRDIDQPLQLLTGSKGDVANHADLKALVKACQERDRNERFKKLEKLLDMDKFISYLVLESLCCDWDGYPNNRNNYRIYHDPKKDRMIFIPSGMDQMFNEPRMGLYQNYNGMVARAVMESDEGKKRYHNRMREILKDVFKPDVIGKRLDALEKELTAALMSIDAGTGRDYKNRIKDLKGRIETRAKHVEAELKKIK